jgi:hypothetical protein
MFLHMATRDRFEHHLKCSNCNNSGTVYDSEDDHPYMKDTGYRVDDLPDDFKVVRLGNTFWKTEFKCLKCEREFLPGK